MVLTPVTTETTITSETTETRDTAETSCNISVTSLFYKYLFLLRSVKDVTAPLIIRALESIKYIKPKAKDMKTKKRLVGVDQ